MGVRRPVEIAGDLERPELERDPLLDRSQPPGRVATTSPDLDDVQLAALDLQLVDTDLVAVVEGCEGSRRRR